MFKKTKFGTFKKITFFLLKLSYQTVILEAPKMTSHGQYELDTIINYIPLYSIITIFSLTPFGAIN